MLFNFPLLKQGPPPGFLVTGMTQWSKFEFANPAIQMIQYTDTVQYVRSIQFSTVRIAEL